MFGRKNREKLRSLEKALSQEVAMTEKLKREVEELNASLKKEAERADKAESGLTAARAANKALTSLNSRLAKKLSSYTNKKDDQKE